MLGDRHEAPRFLWRRCDKLTSNGALNVVHSLEQRRAPYDRAAVSRPGTSGQQNRCDFSLILSYLAFIVSERGLLGSLVDDGR